MAKLNLIETIQTKLSTLSKKDGQLIVVRDNASLHIDLDGNRIYISDWIDVSTDEERLAMLTPLNNKYYYVVETNKIWRYISGSWVLITRDYVEQTDFDDVKQQIGDFKNVTLITTGGYDTMKDDLISKFKELQSGSGLVKVNNGSTLFHGTYWKYDTENGSITFHDTVNNNVYVWNYKNGVATLDTLALDSKVEQSLLYRGEIPSDADYETLANGVWFGRSGNDTYGIPNTSMIYKPISTSLSGSFVICFSQTVNYGIYILNKSTNKYEKITSSTGSNIDISNIQTQLNSKFDSIVASNLHNTDDPNSTVSPVIRTKHSNCPTGDTEYIIYTSITDSATDERSEKRQVAFRAGSATKVYYRNKVWNGEWNAWIELATVGLKYYNGVDLLQISENGVYFVDNPTNTPDAAAGYLFVNVHPNYPNSYRTIQWIPYNSSRCYINTLTGEWQGWKNLDLTGQNVMFNGITLGNANNSSYIYTDENDSIWFRCKDGSGKEMYASVAGLVSGINELHSIKANTNHGNHIPDACKIITDWNAVVTNGWYMASDAANAPGAGWYMGHVVAHNSNYVIQEIYQFTITSYGQNIPRYIRIKVNGTWGAWDNITPKNYMLKSNFSLSGSTLTITL